MAIGPGFWLQPETGEVWRVSRHEYWPMDAANQRAAKFSPDVVQALSLLNVATDSDPIRIIGVQAGLVRVRDYDNRLSIQFHAPPERVPGVLRSIAVALPKLFTGVEHFLTLHNLRDDTAAEITTREFVQLVEAGQSVMRQRPSS